MRYRELLEDKYIQQWIMDEDVAPSTEKAYVMAMQDYTYFTKKTPEQLIGEAKREIKDGLTMDERRIRTYLNNFRKSLQDKELALLTMRNRLVGIRAFYSPFYVDLPKLKMIGQARPTPENSDKIPQRRY